MKERLKNNKKNIIIFLMIVLFLLCFIPNKTNNAKNQLRIEGPYGDIQSYHPKVLAFENKWNGYKYWMSYTPYPQGNDSKENPCIAVSNDLINWQAPSKNTNPLDEPENKQSGKRYNSDSHIVYNNDKNELECYWRYVDDIENKVYIYRKTSKDGITWGSKIITAYSDNRKEKDYISPAIIYENKLYKMWYVDKDYTTIYATSKDGITWNDQNFMKLEYPTKLNTWHLDVIHTKKGYEMLVVAWDKWANRNDMSLYYSYSEDEIGWKKAEKILDPNIKSNTAWDNKGIYRSSFIYEDGIYYVFYGGTDRKYNHGIGLVIGKDIYKLRDNDIDYKKTDSLEKFRNMVKNEKTK